MSRRSLRALGAAAAATALGLTLVSAPQATATGERGPDPDRAPAQAREALTKAKALFDGGPAAERHAEGDDASMVLRELMMTRNSLSGSEARQAKAVLSRPSNGVAEFGGAPVWDSTLQQYGDCGVNVCVHWVQEGIDASTAEYAAQVLAATDHVAQTYIDAGYRPTFPDEGQGSDAVANTKPDIYLANIGDDGLYGYCTSDATAPVDGLAYYAFCVLDNDYSPTEFPSNTPLGNMQVTAAHEYFHAVQYAYDGWDDTWIYEATATWAEDEVYDDVNDNWFYLPYGQLGDPAASAGYQGEGPGVSLDYGEFAYGNWIFFRYLSEKFTAQQGGMSTVVRDIWRKLDTTGTANRYSLQAVETTLGNRSTSMKTQYGQFALENNTPARTYEEGADYPYPAFAFDPVRLSESRKSVSRTVTLDHLTSGTGAFLPFAKGFELKVQVDMTKKAAGSRAAVAVYKTNGDIQRSWVDLNRKGNGATTVPFDSDKVHAVEVTLVNASTQMVQCGTDPNWLYSCGGFGKFENQNQQVTVTAVK